MEHIINEILEYCGWDKETVEAVIKELQELPWNEEGKWD